MAAKQLPAVPTTEHVTWEGALKFEMRFVTSGASARSTRLLAMWREYLGITKESDGGLANTVELLAFIIPLTVTISFDYTVYDVPEMRAFEIFWNWVLNNLYVDKSHTELETEPVIVNQAWDIFVEYVGTKVQIEWRTAYLRAQTRYPAAPELMRLDVEEDELDKDFLADEQPPDEMSESGAENKLKPFTPEVEEKAPRLKQRKKNAR